MFDATGLSALFSTFVVGLVEALSVDTGSGSIFTILISELAKVRESSALSWLLAPVGVGVLPRTYISPWFYSTVYKASLWIIFIGPIPPWCTNHLDIMIRMWAFEIGYPTGASMKPDYTYL